MSSTASPLPTSFIGLCWKPSLPWNLLAPHFNIYCNSLSWWYLTVSLCRGGILRSSSLGVMAVSYSLLVSWQYLISLLVSWQYLTVSLCHGSILRSLGVVVVSYSLLALSEQLQHPMLRSTWEAALPNNRRTMC